MDGKTQKIILDVPYYSQYLDIEDIYWVPRSCGIACVKMVLDFYKTGNYSLADLIKNIAEKGGYNSSGWIHDYLISLFKDCGLQAHREEQMDFDDGIEKIAGYLDNDNPVIISIIKFVLGQTKFHMVVLTGYKRENGIIKGFYYHDPESLYRETGQNLFVDLEIFRIGWRRMAIYVKI